MAQIGFLVDSLARIPADLAQQYAIRTMPLRVVFGLESLREQVDISDDEFLRRMQAAPTLPTTSQPAPGEFVEVYRALAREFDHLIVVLLAGTLSGTVSAATQAAQLVAAEGLAVTVVDSDSAWMGTGMLALAAARAAAAGADAAACVQMIARLSPRMR